MKLRRNLVIAAMSLAFTATGLTGVAVASGGSEGESPGDQARQDAACIAAGISPSATNIDYDDETGVCRLDNESEGQEGQEGKESEESEESESPGDQARQDAACTAAGISPSATNIDYDDETGVCRLDNGGDEGGED